MMTIAEAILNANQIYVAGWEAQQRQFQAHPAATYQALQEASQNLRLREYVHRLSSHRSGKAMVTRVLDRSIGTCPYCGASFNAGHFLVRHQDGRELRFDVALVHYAKMGHVISSEDVDIHAMIAIMEDA